MMMTAVAHPDARLLEAYALGTLEFDDISSLEEHLSECEGCCEMLNSVAEDSFVKLIRNAAVAETWEPAGEDTMLLAQREEPPQLQGDFGLSVAPCRSTEFADAESVPESLLDHGRYRILGRCGSGGMGVVYRAEHRLMGREVALKVIRPHLLRRSDAVDRFRREVRAAALLSHPNIVSAYDAEEAEGFHFLVMEYVAGSDLASVVADRGPLRVRDACDFIRQAADGLAHAHERGMVHRDVKPQNLMLTPEGRIKILDFGLSKFASETEREAASPTAVCGLTSGDTSLTSASTSLGTPDYVAPEQTADTRQADVRADIYGLGCTFYFLLTGRPPFPGSSIVAKLKGHAEQVPRSIADFRDDVPEGVLDVLDRMTAKRPDDRFQTPAEVADALRPFTVEVRTEGIGISDVPPERPLAESAGDIDDDPVRKVESPANGILAVAVLNLVLGVWSLTTMPHVYPRENLWSIWAAVGGISMIPATLIIMQGALRMRRLESYSWSTAAAIYAVIPWTPIWFLGLPMGIWALWTLADPAVRRGFGATPLLPPNRNFRIALGGTLLLLPIAAGAGGIVYIETDRGEIAIEAHDRDARIRVLKGGQVIEVLDPTTNESVTVDTGVYTVQLGSSGFSTSIPEDKEFVVHRGKRKVVTVRRVDGAKPVEGNATTQQILDRLADAYRNCRSYRDSGTLKTVYIVDGGKRTTEKTFRTAFIRPDQFRFEYRDWMGGKEKRYVIWRDGDDVQSLWDINPHAEKPESLGGALNAASAVSGNLSHMIPNLLLPNEVSLGPLTAIKHAKRIADGKHDDKDCFRIEGQYGPGSITIWIDKESFLVRRVDERQPVKDFRTEATTTYDPSIDVLIPDALLAFESPTEVETTKTVEVPLVVTFDPATPPLEKDEITRDGDAWKIEAAGDRTVRLYQAELPGAAGKGITDRLLTYRAQMRTKDVKGRVYLEMWLRETSGPKFFSRGVEEALTGTTDWVEVQTPFWIKDGEHADHADLNIVIEGGGSVWIKDVVLEAHPRPRTPAEKLRDWLQ